MTRLMIALGLVAGLTAAPVLAQEATTIPDIDGNGMWSLDELRLNYPSLTEETFAAMDTSADGQVDQAELDVAMGANLLVAE